MGEFFRGWKRKFGVAMLLMALVAMGGWVRSLCIEDIVVFNSGELTLDMLASSGGGLVWNCIHDVDTFTLTLPRSFHQTYPVGTDLFKRTAEISVNGAVVERTTLEPDIKWQMCRYGFGVGEKDSPSIRFVEIPYWPIVIPLTLLSAWLLLSKRPSLTRPAESPKDQP